DDGGRCRRHGGKIPNGKARGAEGPAGECRARAGRVTIAWGSPAPRARFVLTTQRLDGQVLVRVGPRPLARPGGAPRQRGERLDRVLVAVLGVDRLAGTEFDGLAADLHLLAPDAGEMHLDPRALAVEKGVVLETFEIEIGAELAVDPRQHVEIEFRRHAGR